MSNSSHIDDQQVTTTPDLPLILELVQNQLEDLIATVRAQQTELERQAARIAALERTQVSHDCR